MQTEGSDTHLGARCREFEFPHSDHFLVRKTAFSGGFSSLYRTFYGNYLFRVVWLAVVGSSGNISCTSTDVSGWFSLYIACEKLIRLMDRRCPVTSLFLPKTPPPAALWADPCTAGTPGAAAPSPRFPPGAVGGFWSGSAPERGGTAPAGSPIWGQT